MDEAQPVLRIAGQRGELEGVFQPELRAKKPEVVEKLNGFGVIHAPPAWQMRLNFATFFREFVA